MAKQVIAIEGNATDGVEQGAIVGETTTDIADLSLDFEVETAGVLVDEPRILRLVVVEIQTEGQTVTATVVRDSTTSVLTTTLSTAVGTKARLEIPVALTGSIWGLRLAATGLTKRIEVSAIEFVLDDPDGAT
jgi:hypothetical protein